MRKVLQTKLRYASVVSAVAVAVLLMPLTAQAILVDFETGFSDGDAVGTVGIATFSVGTPGASTGFVAEVGAPRTAFAPDDTPDGISSGFFLTDEIAPPSGPTAALNYFIDFSSPVLNLSLDLYDYRVDLGTSPVTFGDTATLTVYADAARTMIAGMDTFTIPGSNPIDGNVVTLSVLSPSSPILAASLIFSSGDPGTGIDNINFAPIPEPSTLLLFGVGLVGAGFASRRRLREKNGY